MTVTGPAPLIRAFPTVRPVPRAAAPLPSAFLTEHTAPQASKLRQLRSFFLNSRDSRVLEGKNHKPSYIAG